MERHALVIDAQRLRGAHLELLELLDEVHDLVAYGLQGRRNAEPDLRQPHEAQTLLAERGTSTVSDKFVSEHAGDIAQGEGIVRVLKDAPMLRSQDVREVL